MGMGMIGRLGPGGSSKSAAGVPHSPRAGRNGTVRVRSAPVPLNSIVWPAFGPRPLPFLPGGQRALVRARARARVRWWQCRSGHQCSALAVADMPHEERGVETGVRSLLGRLLLIQPALVANTDGASGLALRYSTMLVSATLCFLPDKGNDPGATSIAPTPDRASSGGGVSLPALAPAARRWCGAQRVRGFPLVSGSFWSGIPRLALHSHYLPRARPRRAFRPATSQCTALLFQ
eukprot:gene16729-biopygen21823